MVLRRQKERGLAPEEISAKIQVAKEVRTSAALLEEIPKSRDQNPPLLRGCLANAEA